MCQVVGTIFTKTGVYGDFNWMINQPEYSDSLFIYNDNIDAFNNLNFKSAGAGNAIIRPYRFKSPPRAMPIPTGSRANGGFKRLSVNIKKVIDRAISEIRVVIKENNYKRVFYSSGYDGLIGMSIFIIDFEVRQYITDELKMCEILIED
jgi:hypothetical protein